MDPTAFDTLTRSIARAGTRRRLVALALAGLPLVGGLAVAGVEESAAERPHERLQRRTAQRNRKQRNNKKNNNKNNNKNKNKNNNGGGGLGNPPPCTADGDACTQASQCCSGNCFNSECAELVSQCTDDQGFVTQCNPPALGCGGTSGECCGPPSTFSCANFCCAPPLTFCGLDGSCCGPPATFSCANGCCGPPATTCDQNGDCV